MKIPFLNILFALLLFPLGHTTFAQAKSPQTKAQERSAQMTSDLDLSVEQVAKITPLNLAHYEKLAGIKASGASPRAIETRSSKAKQEHRSALKELLTEEQFQRMIALQAERKAAKKAAKDAAAPGTKGPSGKKR